MEQHGGACTAYKVKEHTRLSLKAMKKKQQHASVNETTFETLMVWKLLVPLALQLRTGTCHDNGKDHRTGDFFIHQP